MLSYSALFGYFRIVFAPVSSLVVFIVVVVVVVVFAAVSRSVAPNSIDLLHFTWQTTRFASEAYIRKVQPDRNYFKRDLRN